MKANIPEPRGLNSVVLDLPAGGSFHAVELSTVDGTLLIRIKDCDVLDLLPLTPRAAGRLMACLAVNREEENAWQSFLTGASSIDQAISLAQQGFDTKVLNSKS